MKTRVLLTGTSGFLAARMRDYLLEDDRYEVLAPSHAELDIIDFANCQRWVEKNHPDAIIHLAAMSDIEACAKNPELSRKINVDGTVNLAKCAREIAMPGRFLFASSDQVYTANHSCDRVNTEDDTLAPENLYGREKVEAEEQALAILPDAIGLRLAWMYDLKPGKMDYAKNLVAAAKARRESFFSTTELRGVAYAREVCENMKKFLESRAAGGAYNFGSPHAGNSYEAALRAYQIAGEFMHASVDGLVKPDDSRAPRSLAMDQAKLNGAGISFRDSVEAVRYCFEREYQES